MAVITNVVRATSTDQVDRSQVQVGDHRLTIDRAAHGGGAPDAVTPADAFLAGVASCAVLVIVGEADDRGLPPGHVAAAIEATRPDGDPSWFDHVALILTFTAPWNDAVVEDLVGVFREKCPLYRTVAAATGVTVDWARSGQELGR